MNGSTGISRFGIARYLAAVVVAITLAGGMTFGQTAFAQLDPGFVAGDEVVVDATGLNLREAASTDAAVIDMLFDGTWATVLGGPVVADGYAWYQLDVDGVTGWAAADEWLKDATGKHGLMEVGELVFVTTDVLNVREAAGTDADVVTQVAYWDIGQILAGPKTVDGYDWYRIDVDGTTGWVARPYLAFAPQGTEALAIGDVAVVNTDDLNLREEAGLDAAVLAVIAGGDTVTITDGPVRANGFTWYEVKTTDYTGWVAGEYLIV